MKLSFRLFVRANSKSCQDAIAALNEYVRLDAPGSAVEVIDLTDKPDVAQTVPIVIAPTLAVKGDGLSEMLVTDLAPYPVLKKTLNGFLSGDGKK